MEGTARDRRLGVGWLKAYVPKWDELAEEEDYSLLPLWAHGNTDILFVSYIVSLMGP